MENTPHFESDDQKKPGFVDRIKAGIRGLLDPFNTRIEEAEGPQHRKKPGTGSEDVRRQLWLIVDDKGQPVRREEHFVHPDGVSGHTQVTSRDEIEEVWDRR
jgi:hypothetical protein